MKVEKFGDIGRAAHENDTAIKSLKVDLNLRWLKMAELLFENKKRRYFEILNYDTFEAYIAQEELGFTRRGVYRIMGIYKDLVLDRKVPLGHIADIDAHKLDMIRPQLPTGDIDDLITKARTLSRSDLKEELHPQEEHVHDYKMRCYCGNVQLSYEETTAKN